MRRGMRYHNTYSRHEQYDYFFALEAFFLTGFFGCGGVASMRRTAILNAGSSFSGGVAMPKPFHGPLMYGPDTLLLRPALAVEMANVISNWAAVEHTLLRLYALVMGTYLPVPDPPHHDDPSKKWAPPLHPVAYLTFEALASLAPKLDLIETLLKERARPEELEGFIKLRPKIRKTSSARNLVAHSLWCRALKITSEGYEGEHEDIVVLRPVVGVAMSYNMADFQDISVRIKGLNAKLISFWHAMSVRMSDEINKQPSPPQEPPAPQSEPQQD